MQAQIGAGMRPGVRRHFAEPRGRNHHGSGGGQFLIEGGEAGVVLRMRHRQIVGVDDEQLGVGGVTEAHIQGLIGARTDRRGQ